MGAEIGVEILSQHATARPAAGHQPKIYAGFPRAPADGR
jgi:hypothetical protein